MRQGSGLQATIDAKDALVARLVEALKRAQHDLSCNKWNYDADFQSEPCTCFLKILAEIAPKEPR